MKCQVCGLCCRWLVSNANGLPIDFSASISYEFFVNYCLSEGRVLVLCKKSRNVTMLRGVEVPSSRCLGIVFFVVFGAFVFGISAGTYQHFPYPQTSKIKDFVIEKWGGEVSFLPERARNLRAIRRDTHFYAFAPNADVVMVGDSITEEGIWHEIFPKLLIANRGVWGDTTADVLQRLDTITSLDAKKAFILLGINDILQSRNVEEILADYDAIATALNYAGTEIYVQSVIECASPKCRLLRNDIEALNQALESYAVANGFGYVNLNQVMAAPDTGLYSRFSNDGVHLLGEGYKIWSQQIAEYMRLD